MRFGFFTLALEEPFEPRIQLHGPVHAARVGVGFGAVAAAELTVPVRLVGVIVGPLSRNGAGVDPCVLEHLIGWEGVVWIDVPILEPPHKVDAAVVILEHVGKVASLVPVIVPLRPTKVSAGPRGERIQGADGVVLAHPHVVVRCVRRGSLVEGVVQHGTAFRGAVSVEHLLDADGSGNRDDGLQVLRGVLRRLPIRRARVGLAHQADVAVGPILLAEPLDHGLNADLLAKALDVLAVGGLSGAKGGGLGEGVTVGHEGVVDPLAHTAIRHGVRCTVVPDDALAAKVVVGMNGHDDRDRRAFGNVRQPQRHVHEIGTGRPEVILARRQIDLNEMLRVRQHIVGAVDRELGSKGVHGQIHVRPLVQGRGPPRGLFLGRDLVVGLHGGGDQ